MRKSVVARRCALALHAHRASNARIFGSAALTTILVVGLRVDALAVAQRGAVRASGAACVSRANLCGATRNAAAAAVERVFGNAASATRQGSGGAVVDALARRAVIVRV